MERESIERLDEGCLDGCAELFASVFGSEPWNEPWARDTARERLEEILGSPGCLGLVCVSRGEVTGLVLGCVVRRAGGRLFYLHEMCVAAGRQGEGIGGRLLARLESRLRESGVGSIFLLTGEGTPAENFYPKSGYEEVPVVAMEKGL